MTQPHPDLLDELYHKVKKKFPDELPFPERFNLKLSEEIFNNGNIRNRKPDTRKIVDFQGNLIREEPITVIEYPIESRLDKAIKNSFPKSFNPFSHVYSERYENIQIGTANKDRDIEYNFHFNPLDKRVHTILLAYDTRKVYAKSFYGDTLRVRIRYAQRISNCEGLRFDCYGYIYIPKRKTSVYTR